MATSATLISSQLKDLLKRTPRTVRLSCDDPNTKRDYDRRAHSKGLAARAIAARAIVRAMDEGSVGHLETILERTEGKVASPEQQAGVSIAFNFNLGALVAGPQTPGSVGEVLQGVLAPQAINPTLSSNPTHTPLTLPAQPAEDKDDT